MPDVEEARSAALRRLNQEVGTALQVSPDIEAWPRDWAERGQVDYFYKSGSLLTHDRNAEKVRSALSILGADDEGDAPDTGLTGPTPGVVQLRARVRESQRTPELVAELEERLGPGIVSHEHAFGITGLFCPATEPEPVLTPQQATEPERVVEALWPPVGDAGAGRDVVVSVVDTGILKDVADWAPWLAGVRPDDRRDIENPDTISVDSDGRGRDGYADPYAGHGSFVAGVIRCLAPASEIAVERTIGPSGFVTESDMITQIHQALRRSPAIISMSAGGYTRHDAPPLGLETLWRKRLRPLGVVLVAAAGNEETNRPFWPAAFDWCVGVGSMTRDGQQRSWFSNHGAWVDVYAPGEDIVNAYPRMKYKTIVDAEVRDTSAGIVKWSGTSFATPIVSGLIAARMSRTGESARDAAAALLAAARGQFRPGVGPRLFP
ncbi:MAG TPA: S8/S53 family peptidase [Jatrophihabitans sp.]|nr:S8/S53 family peptidase [Jatrophihabitans sp.]